ncbi:hypothetical protein GGI24_002738 [Coemansia furcata]|nr:hypothetical protein GGI24_002738 [Coemansia furcata]
MATRNIVNLLNANSSQLQRGMSASNVMHTLGNPDYMGSSLDNLLSPGAAAVPMPGIGLGRPAQQVSQMASDTGEIKTQPIAEAGSQSQQYYLGYDTGNSEILWFHVKVGDDGGEVLDDHGFNKD